MTDKLKTAIAALTPDEYNKLRDAYYQAAEGLRNLAESLESASEKNEELLEEYFLAVHVGVLLRQSNLDKVL